MNRHPFRHMKLTMKLAQAQCMLLLAVEGLGYSEQDYAYFFVANQMVHDLNNPTYTKYAGALGAYLRFYKRLIDKLPEGEFVTKMREEFEKVAGNYKDLLEGKIV